MGSGSTTSTGSGGATGVGGGAVTTAALVAGAWATGAGVGALVFGAQLCRLDRELFFGFLNGVSGWLHHNQLNGRELGLMRFRPEVEVAQTKRDDMHSHRTQKPPEQELAQPGLVPLVLLKTKG